MDTSSQEINRMKAQDVVDDDDPDRLDDCEPFLDSKEREDFAQDGYFENMEPNDDGTWS